MKREVRLPPPPGSAEFDGETTIYEVEFMPHFPPCTWRSYGDRTGELAVALTIADDAVRGQHHYAARVIDAAEPFGHPVYLVTEDRLPPSPAEIRRRREAEGIVEPEDPGTDALRDRRGRGASGQHVSRRREL